MSAKCQKQRWRLSGRDAITRVPHIDLVSYLREVIDERFHVVTGSAH
jgi:hypothetical protein